MSLKKQQGTSRVDTVRRSHLLRRRGEARHFGIAFTVIGLLLHLSFSVHPDRHRSLSIAVLNRQKARLL